jgi:hypothetical protein
MNIKVKKGLTEVNPPRIIKEVTNKENWALCIGAGSSVPIFPNWYDLIKEMFVNSTMNISNENLFKELAKIYSLDSILQSIYSNSNLDEDKLSDLLSLNLYKNLKSLLNQNEWNVLRKVFIAIAPDDISPKVWKTFHDIVNRHFLNTSTYRIAKFIQKSIEEDFPPSAILSFNAEPFLYCMINYFSWLYSNRNGTSLNKPLDPITRGISQKTKKRIHYYFCHGTLKIPETQQKKEFVSTEKLVFLENDYLVLANNAYSWQASSFIDICANQRVFFIGLSLTDPNIRRWLSWIQKNREQEIENTFGNSNFTTHHYWINKKPKDKDLMPWIEANVSHLGIRLIWINEWENLYNLFEEFV